MNTSPRRWSAAALLSLVTLLGGALAGCASSAASSSTTPTTTGESGAMGTLDTNGCVTDYQPGVDYYPVKSEIKYATNFSISYHDS